MKYLLSLALLAALAVGLWSSRAMALQAEAARAAAVRAEAELRTAEAVAALAAVEDDVLHEAMEAMETELEKLGEAVAQKLESEGPESEERAWVAASEALDGLAAALHTCLGTSPPAPQTEEDEGTDGADPMALREREVLFQRTLVRTLDKALETELALVRGDWDAVVNGVDALYDLEQEGHQEFRPKKKRRW